MLRYLVPFAILIPLAGCGPIVTGSGNAVSEDRPVGDIRKVKLSDLGELTITFGSTTSLEVTGDDNIVPLVQTNEDDGTLEISVRGNVSVKTPLKYKLTLKTLDKINLSGAGNATVHNWVGKEVSFSISGAGNLTINECDIHIIKGSLSGAGNMSISGTADEASFTISGAGTVKAEALQTDNIDVNLSGAGSAKVWADKVLKAKVSGAGTVLYKGNPNVKSTVTGAGSVKAMK